MFPFFYPIILISVAFVVVYHGEAKDYAVFICYLLAVTYSIVKRIRFASLQEELWHASVSWVRNGGLMSFGVPFRSFAESGTMASLFSGDRALPAPMSNLAGDETVNYEIVSSTSDSFGIGVKMIAVKYHDEVYYMKQSYVDERLQLAKKKRTHIQSLWEYVVITILLITWPLLAIELRTHMHKFLWFGMVSTIPLRESFLDALVKVIKVRVLRPRNLEDILECLPSEVAKYI